MKKLSELGISPAPWKVDYSDDIDRVVNILDANNKTIVETDYGVYPPELPDARLIAAAPKLYECLREAVLEMCHECLLCGGYPSYECKDPNDRCFLAKWRAALAKAAGEEVRDGK